MYVINPISVDVIASMDDRELESRFRDVRRAIGKMNNPQKRLRLEEEYCYLYREKEVRLNRSKYHEAYLARTANGNK